MQKLEHYLNVKILLEGLNYLIKDSCICFDWLLLAARKVLQKGDHFTHANSVVSVNINHFKNLLKSVICHLEVLVDLLAHLRQVNLRVFLVKVSSV